MQIEELNSKFKDAGAERILAYAADRFNEKVALASSFGAEDMVLIDMISTISPLIKVFTLDTGRLPEETYELIGQVQDRYKIEIEMLFPERVSVERMTNEFGPNLFYESIENRKLCCKVRKLEPLTRKLKGLDAWICGLRREQSITRAEISSFEWDTVNGLIKINPLANWSTERLWQYIRQNNVPYNKLHDRGYPSIGCAPCTRAINEGDDIRAGRWWWENPEHKECGLHLGNTANKKNERTGTDGSA